MADTPLTAPAPTRDDTKQPPRLEVFLNMGTLGDLPEWTQAPSIKDLTDAEFYAALKEAGFSGTQGGDAESLRDQGMSLAGGGRVNQVGEADEICRREKGDGAICGTVHVGWGNEDDDVIDALVKDVLEASARHDFPLYIETHRATVTQDMWRTVQLIERIPEVRFNGDFSHWYTGLEMPYGDFDEKLAFIQPVFERTSFMHGRIGNPQNIQVALGDTVEEALEQPFVQHFGQMWSAIFKHFKQTAQTGDFLVFAPELLSWNIGYARRFVDPTTGELREECDRYADALVMADLARKWFAEA
ncbi:MAG: hypothetical protein AAGI68_01515 [Planctomycetota bacterium]